MVPVRYLKMKQISIRLTLLLIYLLRNVSDQSCVARYKPIKCVYVASNESVD